MANEERVKSLGDYFSLLRRRWQYLATIIPAALLLAVAIAYLLPVSYLSTGVIMLESASLPANMVPSTVTGSDDVFVYVAQQLDSTRRKVMTKELLTEVVKEIDPYPEEAELSARDKAGLIINSTNVVPVDPVTSEPLIRSTAFAINYSNPNRQMATDVTDKLIDLFVTFNKRTRAEQASEVVKFLSTQAKGLEEQIVGMEKRIAQFKLRYGDALPDAQLRNLTGADRAQRDIENFERQILTAQERESLLELQLSETSPSLTASVSDWRAELARLRVELASAEQKYTPDHPDVRRLKRAITDLTALGNSGNAPVAKPDNPEYLRIRSQLGAVRNQIAALQAAENRARGEVSQFTANLNAVPDVERQYVQVTREYANAQAAYQDLQNKIKSANLAQSLESEARGERFAMIKAASTPASPYSPNRLGIILLGIVLGGGLAVLVALLVDASDPTVRSSDDLQELVQGTPIGAVPVILNRLDIKQRRFVWGSVAGAFAMVLVVVSIIVAKAQ